MACHWSVWPVVLGCHKPLRLKPTISQMQGLSGPVLSVETQRFSVCVCFCECMGVVGLRGRGFRGDEALNWRGPQKTRAILSTWCQIMSEGMGPKKTPHLSRECEQVMDPVTDGSCGRFYFSQ